MSEFYKANSERSRLTRAARYIGVSACAATIYGNALLNWPSIHDDFLKSKANSRLNDTTSSFASELLGKEVEVLCKPSLDQDAPGDGQTLGYVHTYIIGLPGLTESLHSSVIHMRTDICDSAVRTKFDSNKVTYRVSPQSIAILAHENEHLLGIENEAAATCYAAQKVPAYLENIGATEANAISVGHLVADYMHENLHPSYLSSECRDEGKLDINAYPIFVTPR